SRPLRVAFAGTGGRARRLLGALSAVHRTGIAAAASPHATAAVLPELGHAPRYTDVAAMLDDVHPDFLIVASSTRTHLDLAREALRREVPVLIEKPLADSLDAAMEFVRETTTGAEATRSETLIAVAHNLVATPELSPLLRRAAEAAADVSVTRRVPGASADAPRTWSAAALYEIFVHLLGLLVHAGFDASSGIEAVGRGASRPEYLRLIVRDGVRRGEIRFEVGGTEDMLDVRTDDAALVRRGRGLHLDRGAGPEEVEGRGSDVELMIAAFAEEVRDRNDGGAGDLGAGVLSTAQEGAAAMQLADAAIAALRASGAELQRKSRPKHAASPGLSEGS
ncbi:MAG: Gfo/Idh/MocA family oxidoreductase, partial [Deltaproteobacteria bacterium]|nr:Gfo/Idh/MocA family oxidoreductase [Deltaproteobacteria bacterium]